MPKYPYDKSCLHCNNVFSINCPQSNKQRYCTQTCANESKRKHHKESHCTQCLVILNRHQRKFCSRSCSSIYHNSKRVYPASSFSTCQKCGTSTNTPTAKYCSSACRGISRRRYDEEYHRKKNAHRQSRYRAKKLRQIHPGADIVRIKEIYLNCPPGYEVDHIVPLSLGGLHHENNLQYLTMEENRRKGNRWIG